MRDWLEVCRNMMVRLMGDEACQGCRIDALSLDVHAILAQVEVGVRSLSEVSTLFCVHSNV